MNLADKLTGEVFDMPGDMTERDLKIRTACKEIDTLYLLLLQPNL